MPKGRLAVLDPQPKEERRSFPPVFDPTCQTMRDIRNEEGASTVVLQVFNWKGDIWGGGSMLAAYEDGAAKQAFTQLKQALDSCRSYEGTGWDGKGTSFPGSWRARCLARALGSQALILSVSLSTRMVSAFAVRGELQTSCPDHGETTGSPGPGCTAWR
ncbi:hypothetical protein ACWELO_35105 [Streptomyces sp. NPDC004596]